MPNLQNTPQLQHHDINSLALKCAAKLMQSYIYATYKIYVEGMAKADFWLLVGPPFGYHENRAFVT